MEITTYDIAQCLRANVAVLERRAVDLQLAVACAEAEECGRGLARHLAGLQATPCAFRATVETMAELLQLDAAIDSPAAIAWLAELAHTAATTEWARLGLATV